MPIFQVNKSLAVTCISRSFRTVGDEMFMEAFENRTLPFEQWTHKAHLRMAWNYIKDYGPENAIRKIK